MARLYDCKKWKDRSKAQRKKEPLCRMCKAENRFTAAQVADHIIPHCDNLDLFWDWDNLQSLCKKCHDLKTYYETNRSVYLPPHVKPIAKEVILLCGSPASGKSTWAKNQKGYTVIDLDDIKCKVSGQPIYEVETKFLSQAIAIRNKMINEAKGKVIIIATLANNKIRARWCKDLKAKLYITGTTMYECINRAMKDKRRKDKAKHKALIKAFFKRYRPMSNETYI